MSKRFTRISALLLVLVAAYFLGPTPQPPEWDLTMPVVPGSSIAVEEYISKKEKAHVLKPDNEARIVWADSTHSKTPYSVVYLHGFSASQKEGDPIHRQFAEAFGCNLYLARLSDHGIDTADELINFTTDRWWESAKEALAIGQAIGDSVIILSTSTGGTMALVLAAEYPQAVHALINMSPNIAINNGAAFLLNNPWGLYIARAVMGGKYRETTMDKERIQYWNSKYRLEATVQLEEMIESKMNTETFARVKQPCLTLYYYKSEEEQDPEVKVDAMLEMMDQLGTPPALKKAVAIPDAGAHVMGSSLVSHDLEGVYHEIETFAIEVLKMQKR